MGLSAYENIGPPLAAHVRDAVRAKGAKTRRAALAT